MIGIIGAMQVEINELVPLISNLVEKKINNRVFYVGNIGNSEVVVVECGVGKVNASITTAMLLENFKIDYIINTGVAGGIGVKPLDLVIGNQLVYHDFDISVLGYEKAVIPGLGKIFNTDSNIRILVEDIAKENNVSYKVGNIASGDIFATSKDVINGLNMDISAVEMEGCAIAQTCKIYDKPFISIRVISDVIGSENQEISFNMVEKKAAEYASLFVLKIIKKLVLTK